MNGAAIFVGCLVLLGIIVIVWSMYTSADDEDPVADTNGADIGGADTDGADTDGADTDGADPPPLPAPTSGFPSDTDAVVFSIQYKNSTANSMIVWLDDQPFCSKDPSDDPDCAQGSPDKPSVWSNLGRFYMLSRAGGRWVPRSVAPGRMQVVPAGDVLRIVPPTDVDGSPYWCFNQPNVGRKCPGVAAWVTKTGVNMPGIKAVSKFEYNINRDPAGGTPYLWFDGSAVDGINVRSVVSYTGCPELTRTCDVDLSTCPVQDTVDGARTCPSPKTWPKIADGSCGGIAGASRSYTASEMAGCPFGTTPEQGNAKEMCHRWWSSNGCGLQWRNWLQDNPSGKTCPHYAWAYDEMRYEDGDAFDVNYNPQRGGLGHTNPHEPLLKCPLDRGSLNIDILEIM